MGDFLGVAFLAILQGITEFLPISSSGHLVIAQQLLGLNEHGIRLELVLHVGTMFSIILYYRTVLARLAAGVFRLDRASLLYAGYVALSAIPAACFYLLCHEKIDAAFESARAVGGFLVFTGIVLTILRWMPSGAHPVSAPRAFLVGIAQALALFPGISRSGMTIASARMAGVSSEAAAEFSFVMSLPLLAGATVLKFPEFLETPAAAGAAATAASGAAAGAALPGWLLAVGALIAAAVGYFSLALLVKTLKGGRFWLFGVYCIIAGILTAAFSA